MYRSGNPWVLACVAVLGLSLPTPAFAVSKATMEKTAEKLAEAKTITDSFILGTNTMNINAAVSRLSFLDAEDFAARNWAAQYANELPVERRRTLMQGLALLAKPPGVMVMVRGLSDEDGAVRMFAVQGIGRQRFKPKEAAAKIALLLGDKTLGTRRESARTLGQYGDAKWGAALVAAAKVEEDVETRAAMLVSTGLTGDKKQIPALEKYLTGDSELTRFAAAQGLVLLGSPAGLKFAKQQLASAEHSERMRGLQLFEGSKAKDAAPVLEPLLKDPDRVVAARAARVLYQGGDATKLDWLVLTSFRSNGDERLAMETELETLRLTDADRRTILKKAGIE